MGRLTVFDHTADVGFVIEADDLDDLFRTAAEGLAAYIVANPEAIRAEQVERVALRAEEPGTLLIAWLNELIFRGETSHRVYARFDPKVRLSEGAGALVAATIAGERIDPSRHELDHEVKAVTHHGAGLVRLDDGTWRAEVILDI